MVCNIYDQTLARIGEIRTYKSLVWSEAYNDVGKVQLVCAAQYYGLLQIGNFIGKSDRPTLCQIRAIEREGKDLWVNGFTANWTLLDDRIYDGTLLTAIVETTLKSAVMAKRPASIVGVAPLRGLPAAFVSTQVYPDLFTLAQTLCVEVDYGFRFLFDKTRRKLLFDVYEGEENPSIKFSEDYGNLANLSVKESKNGFKNFAYVAGYQTEDPQEQVYITVGDTLLAGLARHEMLYESQLQKDDTWSDADYKNELRRLGQATLNLTNSGLVADFDVSPQDFGLRYDLGDKIRVISRPFGLDITARIIEATQTYEKNKEKIKLSVGHPIIRGL